MEFNLPVTATALVALVALGTIGLVAVEVMATSTVLMMVAPSMLVFGAIATWLGVKHGEYRATR